MTTDRPPTVLPSIKSLYTLVSHKNSLWGIESYEVSKVYEDPIKSMQQKSLLDGTKKRSYFSPRGNYLDDLAKTNNTPGPGAYTIVSRWDRSTSKKSIVSERKTYVDGIFEKEKKNQFPAPNAYIIGDTEEKVKARLQKLKSRKRGMSEKVSFTSTCQYLGAQTPGPGDYNPKFIEKKINESKVGPQQIRQIHHEKERELMKKVVNQPSVVKYSPVKYDTFDWRSQFPQTHKEKKNNWGNGPRFLADLHQKSGKQNQYSNIPPGPGQYDMIIKWKGKTKPKQEGKVLTYYDITSRGRRLSVYH